MSIAELLYNLVVLLTKLMLSFEMTAVITTNVQLSGES